MSANLSTGYTFSVERRHDVGSKSREACDYVSMQTSHTLNLLRIATRKFSEEPESRAASARLIALYAMMLCADELSPEAADQAHRLADHLRNARAAQ